MLHTLSWNIHRIFETLITPVLIGLGVHAFYWGLALGLEAIFCDPAEWFDFCTGSFQAISIPVATFAGAYLCQQNAPGSASGPGCCSSHWCVSDV